MSLIFKIFLSLVICTILFVPQADAQYWFGPKIGLNRIDHIYQSELYEKDSFEVNADYDFEIGAAFSYAATDLFAVYGELTYGRIQRTLKDVETDGGFITSKTTNHFIHAPIMLRVVFGSSYVKYYLNGGPRLSFWTGGSGSHYRESFEETRVDPEGNIVPLEFRYTFNSAKRDPEDKAYVDKPERLQYGLTLGGGSYYDLLDGSRLMFDIRYTWVHSNMAINSEADELVYGTPLDSDYYRENYEYAHNILSVSIGYLWSYNTDLKRKGKSTSKVGKKKTK